jgi:hypothetical protein
METHDGAPVVSAARHAIHNQCCDAIRSRCVPFGKLRQLSLSVNVSQVLFNNPLLYNQDI